MILKPANCPALASVMAFSIMPIILQGYDSIVNNFFYNPVEAMFLPHAYYITRLRFNCQQFFYYPVSFAGRWSVVAGRWSVVHWSLVDNDCYSQLRLVIGCGRWSVVGGVLVGGRWSVVGGSSNGGQWVSDRGAWVLYVTLRTKSKDQSPRSKILLTNASMSKDQSPRSKIVLTNASKPKEVK